MTFSRRGESKHRSRLRRYRRGKNKERRWSERTKPEETEKNKNERALNFLARRGSDSLITGRVDDGQVVAEPQGCPIWTAGTHAAKFQGERVSRRSGESEEGKPPSKWANSVGERRGNKGSRSDSPPIRRRRRRTSLLIASV